MDLSKLPSTYYRVTVKAIIRDDKNRLLVGKAKDGTWEVPGGGWEHSETFEQCIQREIEEELGVGISKIGGILFTYLGPAGHRGIMLRLATDIELSSTKFKLGDLIEAKFVDKDQLLALEFVPNEAGIKGCVDKIWPS